MSHRATRTVSVHYPTHALNYRSIRNATTYWSSIDDRIQTCGLVDVASKRLTSNAASIDGDANFAKCCLSVPTQRSSRTHSNSSVCSVHRRHMGRSNQQSVGRRAICLHCINIAANLGFACVLSHVAQISLAYVRWIYTVRGCKMHADFNVNIN